MKKIRYGSLFTGLFDANSLHATHYIYIANKQDGTVSSFKLYKVYGESQIWHENHLLNISHTYGR